MPLQIIHNDIVNMKVDAIVNTANHLPLVGTGLDQEVYLKAGKQLIEDRKQIGTIPYGQSRITKGYHLLSKYIIHTVAPIYIDGAHDESEMLSSCYATALQLTKQYPIKSIAFPLLASGNNSFPKDKALQIAIQEISTFLLEHELLVYLVVFDKESYAISTKLFKDIQSYIDDTYIEEKQLQEYNENTCFKAMSAPRSRNNDYAISSFADEECYYEENLNEIEDLLNHLDYSFSETLLKLIDKTGKKDSEIYKKANVDRKLFNKIKNKKNYKPSKTTTIAFAFALELTLDETKEFISRAGYALSHSNKFDIIVEYFILHKEYNIYALNEVLFAFDQPLVGN